MQQTLSQTTRRLMAACTTFGQVLLADDCDTEACYRDHLVQLREILQASGIGLMLYDTELDALQIQYSSGLSAEYLEVGNGQLRNTPKKEVRIHSPAYRSYYDRKPFYLTGYLVDPNHPFHGLAKMTHSNSIYVAPLIVGEECTGVLAVYHPDTPAMGCAELLGWVEFAAQQFTVATTHHALRQQLAAVFRVKESEFNAAVAQRTRDLEAALRHKDELISIVSHELRTPLLGIFGYCRQLRNALGPGITPQQANLAQWIIASTDRMRALINDLLDHARFQAGKFELVKLPVSYPRIVADALHPLMHQCQEKGLSLQQELKGSSMLTIDPVRIEQVLTNVLFNAIKFSRSGGTIRVRTYDRDGYLVTEIQDTGIGMPAESIERLFAAFEVANAASAVKAGGIGLGLNISKKILAAHGGDIGAASELGRGTTVWFTLPLNDPPEAP